MKLSVIVPTYNRVESLAQCLAALHNQRRPAWEVIVVDDGSTQSVRAQLESRFPEVRWLQQSNRGPSAARNLAAQVSTGDYLVFTDDDCRPAPDWLVHLADAAQRYPGAVLGGSTQATEGAGIYDCVAQHIHNAVYQFYNFPPESAHFFASNNLALPRPLFERLGGFDEIEFAYVSEDRDLCDRIRQQQIQLVWEQRAVVFHHPRLHLVSYCKMFFRYGRGAARYHRARAQRGTGSLLSESGFHLKAPALLWRNLKHSPVPMLAPSLALCLLWQLSNTAGFFWEKFRR